MHGSYSYNDCKSKMQDATTNRVYEPKGVFYTL